MSTGTQCPASRACCRAAAQTSGCGAASPGRHSHRQVTQKASGRVVIRVMLTPWARALTPAGLAKRSVSRDGTQAVLSPECSLIRWTAGAHRPGRAPGPAAGDRIDVQLALVYDDVVHPHAHHAAARMVRACGTDGGQHGFAPRRNLVANSASRTDRGLYPHGNQTGTKHPGAARLWPKRRSLADPWPTAGGRATGAGTPLRSAWRRRTAARC